MSSGEARPATRLLEATDGNFYGMTSKGGADDWGTVFRVTPAGTVTVLHSFLSEESIPQFGNDLVQANDGDLYGTTSTTAFKMTLDGAWTVLHVFDASTEGSLLGGGLLQATDGNFYGTAGSGGPGGRGTVFMMTAAGAVTVLHSFLGGTTDGANLGSSAGLIQAADGNFYGVTQWGGSSDEGTVFRMLPDGTTSVLHSFDPSAIFPSIARLLQATDGNFYGTTQTGQSGPYGSVYRLTSGGAFTIVKSFAGGAADEGVPPNSGLLEAIDGSLYGVNRFAAFRMSLDGTLTVLNRFNDDFADYSYSGLIQYADLVQASDGQFYGARYGGGASHLGELFSMTDAGNVTVLHSMAVNPEGRVPRSALAVGGDGNFYGTTIRGGVAGDGIAFRMTPTGSVSVLHTFTPGQFASSSPGGLTQGGDGNFYGTSNFDYSNVGPSYRGFIRMTPSGTVTGLGGFGRFDTGVSDLTEAGDGNLYGTLARGGATPLSPAGAVFRLTSDGNPGILHQFSFSDGEYPAGGVIQASDGNFYGTTSSGGDFGFGTIFRMTPTGATTVVHAFSGGADGSRPASRLVQGTDGDLYGMSSDRVFKVTLSGTLTPLHVLDGPTEGSAPNGPLVQGRDGNFYGTTASGGAAGLGTVFRMTPGGTVTVVHTFTGAADGASPNAGLVRGPDRNLYGTASAGGSGGTGVIFRVRIGSPVDTDLDGDGTSDLAIYRPSTGEWWVRPSSGAPTMLWSWGTAGDVPVAGDYDGDGRPDIAIYRPTEGAWWILRSSTNYATYTGTTFGLSTDIPVPADYDGDGKTDIAVYRPSNGVWFILQSSTQTVRAIWWGTATDVPVAGDYDGDGAADPAVYRPSTGEWWVLRSGGGMMSAQWGLSGDVPTPGDFDGDGKTDLAVWRPSTGTWFILESGARNGTYLAVNWGLETDVPIVGDYDGDGKADISVYRPSTNTWFILYSRTSYATYGSIDWGMSGDVPLLERP